MELFSVVLHQLDIEVMLTGKGLVLSRTKEILDGLPRELPPLYGGLGPVVMVVWAWVPMAKSAETKVRQIFPNTASG